MNVDRDIYDLISRFGEKGDTDEIEESTNYVFESRRHKLRVVQFRDDRGRPSCSIVYSQGRMVYVSRKTFLGEIEVKRHLEKGSWENLVFGIAASQPVRQLEFLFYSESQDCPNSAA